MTTKFKILSSISFIALAIVLTFVGVWAMTDLDFLVGGNITYTAPEPSIELYWDSTNSYWYVKMGTYEETPVVWRLVGLDGEKFTGSSAPTSGTGTFILETNTNIQYIFDEINFWTDYATSGIREYLKGQYLADLNLTNDITYKAITPRSIADLYQNMTIDGSTYQVKDCTLPSEVTGADSLWLMSVAEIYTLVGGGTITNNTIDSDWSPYYENLKWGTTYWLRSPKTNFSGYLFYVAADGRLVSDDYMCAEGVRPAFNLEF